jgi:hypothetical protein
MKAGNEIVKTFNELPNWAKGVIAIAGVGVGIYVGLKVYKMIQLGMKDKGNKKEDTAWNKEFDKLNSNPATKATLSKVQLSAMANQMQIAMDGVGTDEETIYRVLSQVKNNTDWVGLNAAYGIRDIKSGLFWEATFRGTLTSALSNELSDSPINPAYFAIPAVGSFIAFYKIAKGDTEISAANKILAKNGVSYKI